MQHDRATANEAPVDQVKESPHCDMVTRLAFEISCRTIGTLARIGRVSRAVERTGHIAVATNRPRYGALCLSGSSRRTCSLLSSWPTWTAD